MGQKKNGEFPHLAYSLEQGPSDYHLAHVLAKQHFTNFEEIKEWFDEWIASKPKQFFHNGIHPKTKKKLQQTMAITSNKISLTIFVK